MAKNNVVDISDSSDATTKTPQQWHKHWSDEMDACEKRLREYLKAGNAITARYLDQRGDQADSLYSANFRGVGDSRLNLFWVNVSTQLKMLYGQTPKVTVEREHNDPDDDVARVAAVLYKRILDADALPSGTDIGNTLQAALQDRLLPGMGTARVLYKVSYKKEKQMNPETMEVEEVEVVDEESCDCPYVHWQDFRWGWARTWPEIPWQAFRSFLTRSEAKKRFGAKIADQLEYKEQSPAGGDKSEDDPYGSEQKSNVEKAEIWEIWDKKTKKVFWWSKGGPDLILDVQEDPLQLEGFWPSPKPMIANPTTTLFMPKADFRMAQDLYNEIDELQSRVTTITRAVKVVGVYNKNTGDSVGRMLKEGVENDMIPVDEWAMFAEKGGLKGNIDWFPVQDVVGVLQTLIQIRDQTIELLYQITGMSDILRGANTDQYTSDGTNQLKAKFGSIRIQALQDEFAGFASDLDQLKAEVVSKHFDQKTIFVQSNAQFMPQADQDKIGPALQLMKSPGVRWRVDIRPESLAMVDYAQLKSERTEFMTAMATYIQSAQAMAKQAPTLMPMMLEVMKWAMAGFKGADYLEGTMDQAIQAITQQNMQEQQNPKPDPEAQKQQGAMQLEQAKQQGEMQKIQAKSQSDMSLLQAKFQTQMQILQMQASGKSEAERAKIMGDLELIRQNFESDMALIRANLDSDLAVEEMQSTMAVAEEQVSHANTLSEEQQQHSNDLALTRAKPSPTGGGE